MRMGTVIGRVTLSARTKKFAGERLLLTASLEKRNLPGGPKPLRRRSSSTTNSVPTLASTSRSAKAARLPALFPTPTPVDAYCAASVDEHFYRD